MIVFFAFSKVKVKFSLTKVIYLGILSRMYSIKYRPFVLSVLDGYYLDSSLSRIAFSLTQ